MPTTKPSKKPIIDMPSKKQLKDLVQPYSDEELTLTPEQQAQLDKTMKLLEEYGIDFSKFKPEHLSFITGKRAYPNYDQYQYIPGRHDVKKWLFTVKDINYKQKAGFPFREAIKTATNGWPKMEIYDFLNWLRFHEEGAHMKYKFAQVWYVNDSQPGYFLHVKPDAPKEPEPTSDGGAVEQVREDAERQEEKRQMIEKQRAKIIGRLDSAEKLLRSPEGQHFAGTELEALMEAIYALKKKVQLVNKLSIATRLYEDMIVREGNILKRDGFVKAAEVLYSIAQTPGQSGEKGDAGKAKGGALPIPPSPPDPSGAGQVGTNQPTQLPGTPNAQTSAENDQNKDQPPVGALGNGKTPPPGTTTGTEVGAPPDKPQAEAIKQLTNNMNIGNKTDATVADDDELEVRDEELMVTEAQAVAPPGVPPAALEDVPMTDAPPPERNPPTFVPPAAEKPEAPAAPGAPADEEPLEVTEDDLPKDDAPPTSGFDAKMDQLLQSVTIEDVVAELEEISKEYKTREQPRRLSYVDMMLDSLGLASMFPSLSEAQNKALEATNYISTRVDDILAKLRGAIASQEKPQAPAAERPEVAGIKSKLQNDQDKEKQRKQMRKDQEAAELEGGGPGAKPAPAVELGELGAAPAVPAAPAAPAAGPAPRPLG